MSPTQPVPWRQKIGPCIIQQEPELEESPDVLEHAYQVENQACETNAVKRFKVVGCSGSQGTAEPLDALDRRQAVNVAMSRRVDQTGSQRTKKNETLEQL